jgi:hypothetical protein
MYNFYDQIFIQAFFILISKTIDNYTTDKTVFSGYKYFLKINARKMANTSNWVVLTVFNQFAAYYLC